MSIILSHQRDPGSYRIQGNHNFSKYEDLIQLQWKMSWKFLKFVTIIYLYLILLSGQLIQQGKSFPCLYPQLYISTVQQIRQVFQVSKNKWRKKNCEITAVWFNLWLGFLILEMKKSKIPSKSFPLRIFLLQSKSCETIVGGFIGEIPNFSYKQH